MFVKLPTDINWRILISEIKATGMLNREIEAACSLAPGYVSQLQGGHIKEPIYEKGAAIYNLWVNRSAR